MNAITESNPTELPATIKLGIETHAKWFYVAAGIPVFNPSAPNPPKARGRKGVR